jgi:serine/threonine-protein kinase
LGAYVLKVGDDLGRYELIAHLKNGGMASLFLGRRTEPSDNRIFAIKVVHPHLLDDTRHIAMFRDEAGLSLRIDHPNVVHVEEVGEDKGRHYLAMEYVHGCSLAQLLQALIRRGRRMSPDLATYVAMAVAEGLHAAHETNGPNGEPLNVVHRDVSPQNILLSHNGEIKLIDFGIAKSRLRIHHSQTGGAIKGKLRYMSPEHALGRGVDRRTDIYALGIILWEMLTMRPLFWSTSDLGLLPLVRDPKVEPPSRFATDIPPELDSVVMQALAKSASDRPPTALAFRQLLSTAMPFAEALDEEQVSELLHVVLGDEMGRRRQSLPKIVALEIGAGHPAARGRGEVLNQLTSVGIDSDLLDDSLHDELEPGPLHPVAPDAELDGVPNLVMDDLDDEVEGDHTALMSPEELQRITADTELADLPDLMARRRGARSSSRPRENAAAPPTPQVATPHGGAPHIPNGPFPGGQPLAAMPPEMGIGVSSAPAASFGAHLGASVPYTLDDLAEPTPSYLPAIAAVVVAALILVTAAALLLW